MPKILTRNELFRLLQRELPQDVYPQGGPSTFYSTASLDSKAKTMESAYNLAETAYDNIFPASAEELLNDWEIMLFGELSDSSLSTAARRARILEEIRSRRGVRKSDIEAVVRQVLGSSTDFEVVQWNSSEASWMIGVSPLGASTFLASHPLVSHVDDDINCGLVNGSFPAVSQAEEDLMREQAFTYEVRIYNQTLTSTEESDLDAALTEAELVRSQHVITDGLTDSDKIEGDS